MRRQPLLLAAKVWTLPELQFLHRQKTVVPRQYVDEKSPPLSRGLLEQRVRFRLLPRTVPRHLQFSLLRAPRKLAVEQGELQSLPVTFKNPSAGELTEA